jgi:hypothetical protein
MKVFRSLRNVEGRLFVASLVVAMTLAGQSSGTATSVPGGSALASRQQLPVASPAGAPEPRVDYNGDGFGDLAVAAAGETVDGEFFAGAVNVLYGSAEGLQADDPPDQFWSNATPGIPEDPQDQGTFGDALESSDFNADGFTDLAIGAPELNVGERQRKEAGAVTVLYGSPAGLQITSPPLQQWSQESPGVQGVFEAFDHFGAALSAGDFNADGFHDLAIGVPQDYEIGPGSYAVGAVNVLFGSPDGLQADAPDDQFWIQLSPGVERGYRDARGYGNELTAGDFNGDGIDDLVVCNGDRFVNLATQVHILYGSPGGLQAVAPDDQVWTQNSPGVQGEDDFDEKFGYAVAAADFNLDGYDDLAICALVDHFTQVLYGSPDGLQAFAPDDERWSQDTPHVQGEAGPDWEILGTSLATADFNADGFPDLAATVRYDDVGSVEDAGSVQILFGSPLGLQATSPDDQLWTRGSPGVRSDPQPGDAFGGSTRGLAANDFNGDGLEDLAMGVPGDHEFGGGSGAVAVLHGAAGVGLQAVDPDDQLWWQDSPGVLDRSERIDNWGSTLG